MIALILGWSSRKIRRIGETSVITLYLPTFCSTLFFSFERFIIYKKVFTVVILLS